ncbi:lipoyl synthase [Desulfovibrio desulfuricans]|uniref:Lipoyl synthase n=1 Tax=Desulfovibrio desulfuricans TaxID=876 RepID=A0A4P7UF95_DESDE|nr:lipoyl synthase [Desulfovibrio desulfuricans]QCC84563.1 lipoyl synthase [Desulfovibrio desulfuricans]
MTQPDSTVPQGEANAPLRKPAWLRRPLASDRRFFTTSALLNEQGLSTVCKEANCPNRQECFSSGTATFLILGETCTRNCRFCNIHPGQTSAPDPTEPQRVAQAAVTLGLKHVVVTSVTRDDLDDGGSAQFAAVIRELRQALPQSSVEVLIPDFQGDASALRTVMDAKPDIINHNVETHPDLYTQVRPQADYVQSLELLRRVSDGGMTAKSGLMVGLSETDEQVRQVMADLHAAGCSIVTIGQYLPPTSQHHRLDRYVTPEQFDEYAAYGRSLGLRHVFSGPLVRSSYHAANFA